MWRVLRGARSVRDRQIRINTTAYRVLIYRVLGVSLDVISIVDLKLGEVFPYYLYLHLL